MRYAIINTFNNAWEYESEDLDDIKAMAQNLRATGMNFVVVQIIPELSNEE